MPVTDIKTMLLYLPEMEEYAIRYADMERSGGKDTACVRFDPEKTLEDYISYGHRNQFEQ